MPRRRGPVRGPIGPLNPQPAAGRPRHAMDLSATRPAHPTVAFRALLTVRGTDPAPVLTEGADTRDGRRN